MNDCQAFMYMRIDLILVCQKWSLEIRLTESVRCSYHTSILDTAWWSMGMHLYILRCSMHYAVSYLYYSR